MKKLSSHGLMTLIFFILTIGQQYFFYWFKGLEIVPLPLGKYFGLLTYFFVTSFIASSGKRLFWLSFFMLLNFFQMAHLSYFGTQILPSGIYLLFAEISEIQGTLLAEPQHLLFPLLFTIIPVGTGYLFLRNRKFFSGSGLISPLLIVYLLYNPARTYWTSNTWGRQPSTRELSGFNVYLSFSYFLGRILPAKFSGHSQTQLSLNTSSHLKIENSLPSKWDKIIFILGESLSPDQMELFNYSRPTTPFLKSLKDQNFFYSSKALSGGVSTDISVAFFMNLGFGDAGPIKATKAQHCLFRLAKNQKMTTAFLSSQSSQQLRYITPYVCSSFLDDFRALENLAPTWKNDQDIDDQILLPHLELLLKNDKKQFIVLHQRGSHAPWELRSQVNRRVFPHTNQLNQYDNSVVEFDLFMKRIYEILKKSNEKILLIYTSDHGEGLGKDGVWGHGSLFPSSFEVPFFVMSFNHELPVQLIDFPILSTHYNISLFLAEQMGITFNQKSSQRLLDFEIYGNDIDGFAGKASIQFNEAGIYQFKRK